MKRGLCCAVVLAAVTGTALGGPGTWSNYTSMKECRGIARSADTYWAGTSGGVFGWTPATGAFRRFTNAEGLMGVDITALVAEGTDRIWTGTSTGVLHLLTPSDGIVRPILDIALSSRTSKRINTLSLAGDTLLVGTEFGLSLFRTDRLEFGDTYEKFGAGTQGIRFSVTATLKAGGKLWAGITDGQTINQIAVGDPEGANLLAPESWILETAGAPGEKPTALATFNGFVYAGTSGGLYLRNAGTWTPVLPLQGYAVAALHSTAGGLLIAARAIATGSETILRLDAQGTVQTIVANALYPLTSLTSDSLGAPSAGSTGGGILSSSGGWIAPDGPNSNQFIHVEVTPDGILWAAAGPTSPAGVYRFDGKKWKSYTMSNSSLLTNGFWRVSVDCDGAVWLSSFGRGLVEVPRGSDSIESSRSYYLNVGMIGLPNDPLYVVPSTVACDGKGNRWASIVYPANRRTLVVRTAAGTWQTLPTYVNGNAVNFLVDTPVDKELAVDAFDNLWAVCRDANARGVISLGNGGAIDSTAAVLVSSANGLPSDDIRTIVVDRENDIWVGTDKGIGIILDPSNPKRQGGIALYKPLNGLMINTIAVDALNQKWVGTSEGVVLLSGDGTQVLANYTLENTEGKLISNDIKSIAIDQNSGTVFFGTLYGMSSLTTTAAAPRAEFADLKIYPNPYRIPSASPLTVDGLVENSRLKILTTEGRLIRDIRTPGGRVGFWDGKDGEGQDVASGIYIVVAFDESGERIANGKVAVLRK